MVDSLAPHATGEFHEEEIEYRSIDLTAVFALLFGLLSPLALIDTPGWLVPLTGMALAGIALRRIRREPGRIGRGAALCGLALSMVFLAAPVARLASGYYILARQGRPMAEQFFEYLREDSPAKALMLTFGSGQRVSSENAVWFLCINDADTRKQMQNFVKHPVVRTLLALGDKADIEYFETEGVAIGADKGKVNYLYTVTFPSDDGKQTFLVRIKMDRRPAPKPWQDPWRVDDFELVTKL